MFGTVKYDFSVIMHQTALEALQHAAPLRVHAVEGPLRRAQHVQTLRPPGDPEARLVQMLHFGVPHQLIAQPLGAGPPVR